MGKKILFVTGVAAISLFSACKEKAPLIDFGGGAAAKDTTYTTTTEAAELRNVLVEEFTGATCPNCPAGHEKLSNIDAQYPGRLITMSLHTFKQVQATPVDGSKYDFRSHAVDTLITSIYNSIPGLPVAGIDRITNATTSSLSYYATEWALAVQNRMAVTTPANIHLSSTYDAVSGVATIDVKVAYTQTVTNKQKLTVAILEDSLVDKQEDSRVPGGVIDDYKFNHIFRDFVTPINGAALLDTIQPKAAGRVIERVFSYNMKPEWIAKNCKVVAILSNNEAADITIVQAATAPVKP